MRSMLKFIALNKFRTVSVLAGARIVAFTSTFALLRSPVTMLDFLDRRPGHLVIARVAGCHGVHRGVECKYVLEGCLAGRLALLIVLEVDEADMLGDDHGRRRGKSVGVCKSRVPSISGLLRHRRLKASSQRRFACLASAGNGETPRPSYGRTRKELAPWRHDLSADPGTKTEGGRHDAALSFPSGLVRERQIVTE
jgi:hypothetical protein